MNAQWALALGAPALAAYAVIALARSARWSGALSDHPNERSLHVRPTPRVGGIGLIAAALAGLFWFGDGALHALAACALVLAIVSLADDVRSLPIAVRLPAHFAAAAVAILAIGAPMAGRDGLGIVEALVGLLAIVWMANLYNFMDGSDGLAGGMAIAGFGACAAGAAAAGEWPLALGCACIASAAAGFLAHNFPPARVFLGDAGSVPLGFLAGAIGLHGMLIGAWTPVFPLLAFSPFIADATVTLARRIARGEPFWRAHRSHFYQRLVMAGWSRRRLAWGAYALMAFAAASALAARTADPRVQSAIIAGWIAVYALLFIAIERHSRLAPR
jgi:UDP-N-acetylmuramyl pentapeptide phosphotransferase/UDP-N-acetylglucosamine-1-phosphate transferase